MSCKVLLNHPGPFQSGSSIDGTLICNFTDSIQIRGIKIRIKCDEHTEWWGTVSYYNARSKRHIRRSVMFTGNKNLISLENMLFGGNSELRYRIGPGQKIYPFSIHLPESLPSSYENSYGHIRYSLKGIVDIPWAIDFSDKINFVLISPVNLNYLPLEYFQPSSRIEEKKTCFWCSSSGNITMEININKTAFVPGEEIKFFITMTNMSNTNVGSLESKLVEYTKSHVKLPTHETKTKKTRLASNIWEGVGAHGENVYDIKILIPSTVRVPNLIRSTLFEISHEVELHASLSGCHTDIDLSFIVVLGQVQHRTVNERQRNISQLPGIHVPLPTAPSSSSIPNAPSTSYMDQPPDYDSVFNYKPKNTAEKHKNMPSPSAPGRAVLRTPVVNEAFEDDDFITEIDRSCLPSYEDILRHE